MIFDPHLTYRGSGDEAFALIALMASAAQRRPWTKGGGPADRLREQGGLQPIERARGEV
jgi:hypothetical protein